MAKYVKGLSKDTAPEDQPAGTWRHARNITMHPKDGALTVEEGSSTVQGLVADQSKVDSDIAVHPRVHLPFAAMVVIGSVEITDDRVILFSTFDWDLVKKVAEQGDDFAIDFNNNAEALEHLQGIWNGGNPFYSGEIGEFDGKTYKTLYRPNRLISAFASKTDLDLGFTVHHPIEGTYKKNPDGELFVYWTDDHNPPRVINITRQKNWLRSGVIESGPNQDQVISDQITDAVDMNMRWEYLYGIDFHETKNRRHKDLLNLFPSSGPVPEIQLQNINQGGGLWTGAYFLALAYVDQDLVQTNYVTIANPVFVVEDNEGVLPIERYDGAPIKSPSGKSITWAVSNLNTDYEYVRPAVVRKGGGQAQAYQLNDIPLQNLIRRDSSGNLKDNYVTFTGLEGFKESSVPEIIVDTVSYDTAKTINQLDGILYLGNLSGQKDLGYQKYANHITLEPEIKLLDPFDPHQITQDVLDSGYIATDPLGWNWTNNPILEGYRYSQNLFKFKGYTRDEVYAFYIAFIMNDGTESYAYHIPGRGALQLSREQSELIPTWNANTNLDDGGNSTIFVGDGSQWESGDILNPGLIQLSDYKGRIFHFYETSGLVGANNMNYWHNTNEFYPTDVLNRDNWEVWDAAAEFSTSNYAGVVDSNGNISSLSGRRVRHHHFPSNENQDFQVFAGTDTEEMVVEDLAPRWYALDFKACTGIVTPPSGLFDSISPTNTMAVVMEDEGIDIGEANAMQPENSGDNMLEFTQNLEENWGDTGDQDGEIIIFADTTMPSGSNVWPNKSTRINWAFVKRNHSPQMNEGGGKFVGSYGGSMYVGNGNAFGGEYWPSSWNNSSGATCQQGDLFVQGGGNYGYDYRPSNGGPTDFDGCDTIDSEGMFGNAWKHNGKRSIYWGVGCMIGHNVGGWGTPMSLDGFWNVNAAGCGGLESEPCKNKADHNCDTGCEGVVVWANDTGSDNCLIFARVGNCSGSWPDTWGSGVSFNVDECDAMIWFRQGGSNMSGPIFHTTRALGFSLDNIKVPREIADKTQGFRIYYANREHEDRRVLGQNILHPQVPTLDVTNPQCVGADLLEGVEMGDEFSTGLNTALAGNRNNYWINWPYTVGQASYGSVFEDRGRDVKEYQAFSFHDFYLMRTHNNITAATHFKVEYLVDMMPWAGPGVRNDCDPSLADFDWDQGEDGAEDAATPGAIPCWQQCLSTSTVTTGFQIAFSFWNASDIAGAPFTSGSTGGASLYNWIGNHHPATNSIGDLNRPIKERAKSYVKGDSIFNGKQLGFGYKGYNEYGESHVALAFHERYGILPAFANTAGGDGDQPSGVKHEFSFGEGVSYDGGGTSDTARKSMYYQGNLHAFRLDVYNSIDTQNLVWTGFQVIGEAFKGFCVGTQMLRGNVQFPENQKYGTKRVFEYFNDINPDGTAFSDRFRQEVRDIQYLNHDGKIFGGDTHIARHGWRKTLRPNLWTDGGALLPQLGSYMGRDYRFVYETLVECTDNINFRHVETPQQIYWPGSTIRDLAEMDSIHDLTGRGNIGYNDDYSAVNDLGHTAPLPLQVSQPSNFPTRVVRSNKSDDSSLVDGYRQYLPNQFNDLPKNRGELWKISVFNNLLYFHMEDSILRTKGKQTMQLGDGSDAFIGSGDIFAQPPDELVQTDSGHGGSQSQWATTVTNYGYFCMNQKERSVYLITDALTNISSIGMEKWFQKNIPFAIERYQALPPNDNPYYFGFHAVWDEGYKRILLTKKELIPTKAFKERYEAGTIRYNIDENIFEWTVNGEVWEPILYSPLPQQIEGESYTATATNAYDFNTYPPANPFNTGNSMMQSAYGISYMADPSNPGGGWWQLYGADGALDSDQMFADGWSILAVTVNGGDGPVSGYYPSTDITLTEFVEYSDNYSAAFPDAPNGQNSLDVYSLNNLYSFTGQQYSSTGVYYYWYLANQGGGIVMPPKGVTGPEPERVVDGATLFEPSGWTISFNPELNVWVSFHDVLPYHYTSIGENLYYFMDFKYRHPNAFGTGIEVPFGLYPDPGFENDWWGQDIWWWHPPLQFISNSNKAALGTDQAEIEVIHNEMNDMNQVYTNFSFCANVLQPTGPFMDMGVLSSNAGLTSDGIVTQGLGLSNSFNSVPSTQIWNMGFQAAIVYNSHQCSGLIDFLYLQNIRQNGADWCVNKFRDITRHMVHDHGVGDAGAGTVASGPAEYEFVSDISGDYEDGVGATTDFGHQIWINTGMAEYLNPLMLNYSQPGRKFVDKWIGIRLICKSSQYLVNLLSTKVGTRKYHRHE